MRFSKEKYQNAIYKKKILCGLWSVKLDIRTAQVSYRLFGIKVARSVFSAGVAKVNFLKIFNFRSKRLTAKLLVPLLVLYLRSKQIECEDREIIGWYTRSGEFFLMNYHLKEYFKNEGGKAPLLLSPGGYLRNVASLFRNNLEFHTIPMIFVHLHHAHLDEICLPGFKYREVLNHQHFIDVERHLQAGEHIHFYEAIKARMHVSDRISDLPMCPPDVVESASLKMKMLGLQKPFVFISPSALSNGTASREFWDKLPLRIHELGYDMFFNELPFGIPNSACKTCYLTLPEARYVAGQAAAIIGIRSGLMDVIANQSSDIHCIYKAFGERGPLFPSLSADKVMRGFDLKLLPHVNADRVHNYNGDTEDESSIMHRIVDSLAQQLSSTPDHTI